MQWAAAVLVIATLVVMTAGWVKPVIALGGAIVIAGLTGIATRDELFAGLSNGGVITVGAMLVIAKGVVKTGIVSRVTGKLLSTVDSAGQAFARLAVPVGVASGLMNTTPIVAMLIPASRQLEQTRDVPARELMLPIAHLTTLTGSITLIGTSSNLLIAGIAGDAGVDMGMISFGVVALPVAVVGVLVIAVAAPRLLAGKRAPEPTSLDWRVEIPIGETAVARGRSAEAVGMAVARDYQLDSILRDGQYLPADTELHSADTLVYRATEAGIPALWSSPHFGLQPERLYTVSVKTGETGTINDLSDENITVIAARSDVSLRRTPLVPGATCYLSAPTADTVADSDYVAVWQAAASRAPQPRNTWKALLILAAVVGTASAGLAPIEYTSVAGALLMVVTGVLTPRSAGRALDWPVLFTLAGSVGLGAIVLSSGLADTLADGIRYLVDGSPLLVVVVFAVVTAILTNVISNAAAASILTPVAVAIAADVGMNPVVLLALVGTCISFTFLNPYSHQTNLMMLGPIGYSTKDFVRFGIPVLLAGLATAIAVGALLGT
ncbi:SLC13 family permease [Gordonia spumicola]|uniref:SLC13 family permease n=1 Tax=Gordonia spumicola TaxID=589161 RepID=A0A7I9VB25_9ACTN|nr:SLC13 family permease [Gordonia spumicola]GEE02321.1 SLC13 family permease [Gordonia spumicola]